MGNPMKIARCEAAVHVLERLPTAARASEAKASPMPGDR